MADEKNVGMKQPKTTLTLEVTFERKIFKGEEGRESKYVQCTATYLDESFRFKVTDKDARLFQYLMKQQGFALLGQDGNVIAED